MAGSQGTVLSDCGEGRIHTGVVRMHGTIILCRGLLSLTSEGRGLVPRQYRIDLGWIMVLWEGRPPMQGQSFGDKAKAPSLLTLSVPQEQGCGKADVPWLERASWRQTITRLDLPLVARAH